MSKEHCVCNFSSVAQSCLTLCNPTDCSTPGLPVYHQLSEFTQTHVHWVGDAMQPSHPLSSPSPTFNLFQHQGLFKWDSSSDQVAKYCSFSFSISPSHPLWLQSTSVVILEPPKIKSVTVSTVSPSICHEVMGPDAMILVFWILSFKPTFSLSSFILIKRLFNSSLLSVIRVLSSAYLRLLIFLLDNLYSSLCFIQPSILHDVLCI